MMTVNVSCACDW